VTDPGLEKQGSPGQVEPPRYKRAIVIWIALYPAVVVALALLRPVIGEWPIPLQALVLTVIIIPAAVWMLIPLVQRLLRVWLEP
jgi:antibiotic biosynthesis monooxygenase (ABM) superfamily enzyme